MRKEVREMWEVREGNVSGWAKEKRRGGRDEHDMVNLITRKCI